MVVHIVVVELWSEADVPEARDQGAGVEMVWCVSKPPVIVPKVRSFVGGDLVLKERNPPRYFVEDVAGHYKALNEERKMKSDDV